MGFSENFFVHDLIFHLIPRPSNSNEKWVTFCQTDLEKFRTSCERKKERLFTKTAKIEIIGPGLPLAISQM